VNVGQQFVVDVSLDSDTGPYPLGAYGARLAYDPSVLSIVSVKGGTTPEFSPAPFTNPVSFTSGATPISAFQNASLDAPFGITSGARVTFTVRPKASGAPDVALAVQDFVDVRGEPMPVNGTRGCSLVVTGSAPTTCCNGGPSSGLPCTTNADCALGGVCGSCDSIPRRARP
jgi:hypothetical protein